MEARINRAAVALGLALFFFLVQLAGGASAAGYRTTNFIVSAPSPQLSKEIGDAAEQYRRDLAIEWTGKELPQWSKPCPITARVAPNLGAGGATSFVFDRGEVFDWKMNIQGSRERILDSVLPHEVTHMIFASHFRQPVPRWADEGGATTVEYRSEQAKQERMLINFLKTRRAISFDEMFAMKDYPQDVMPLYSQGHSVTEWLIESRGRKAFLDFVGDGMRDDNWPRAVRAHYGFENLYAMQTGWLDWVKQGRPRLTPDTSPITQLVSVVRGSPDPAQVARSGDRPQPSTPAGNHTQPAIYRGQSPDDSRQGDKEKGRWGETPVDIASAVRGASDPAQGVSIPIPATTASGSVYATAARAQRERQGADDSSAAEYPRPIYDASLGSNILRR